MYMLCNICYNYRVGLILEEEYYMKKSAYTLAEALIAIAIVGVIAAVGFPLVNKYKPDANKVMFLKTYDSLHTVLNELATNNALFPIVYQSGGQEYNFDKIPFLNDSSVTVGGTTYSGPTKLCDALADALNASKSKYCANGTFTTPQGGSFWRSTVT